MIISICFKYISPVPGKVSAVMACVSLLLLVGCRTDWDTTRHSDSMQYTRQLQEDSQRLLDRFPEGLDLTNCVAIAQERNTRLLASQISAKVAQMDRKAAFSAFLPQVQLTYNALSLSEEPLKRFGENSLALQDKNVRDSSVQIVQPLFAPSSWLLYRSAKRGAEIAALAQERTAQMIELSVVSCFYQCGAMGEEETRLNQEAEAARQLLRESEAMAREGYLADAELSSVRVMAMEQERARGTVQRETRLAQARLLQLMNLWPLANIPLKTDTLLDESRARYVISTPGEECREFAARDLADIPVEEWMYHALLSRKEMQIQDRTIALRRNETLRALAMFLPNLMGFANYYTTSDSYTVNQEYWGTGLQASLSAFVGFRDVASYLKARQEAKGAYVEREETAMMILLQVVEAYKNLQDAEAFLAVTEEAGAAAEQALTAMEAQYRADFVPLSQLLQARAAHSQAMARKNTAAFANAVALYAFKNVVGGHVERTESSPEAIKNP